MPMPAELRGVPCYFYIFCIFFKSGISVPSFIIVGYVWQILGWEAFTSPSVSSPEKIDPEMG